MEKVLIKTDFEKIENWSQDRKMFKFLLLLFLTLESDLIIGKWRARKVKCLNRKKIFQVFNWMDLIYVETLLRYLLFIGSLSV